MCTPATKKHLGRRAEPRGRIAFGHSLGLALVNQACPTNEVRAKGTLGTKLRGGRAGRGGGLRCKRRRDLGVSHCTIPRRHASVRHSCSQEKLCRRRSGQASTATSARSPQPRPSRRYCCLRRCHLLIPSLGHPSIRESFSAHLWARGLSGSRHLKRFAGLLYGRSGS